MIHSLPITAIPAEDEALREPVRAFLAEALKDLASEDRIRSWMGFDATFSRALAERGWIGMTLPVEYGGGGAAPSRGWFWSRKCWRLVHRWRPIGLPTGKVAR